MNQFQLREALESQGLGRVAEGIMALTQPTVWAYPRRAAEPLIPVGASKIGGLPDLPEGVDWPSWHEPMVFLAQFNLAETARFDSEGVLPQSGLLSFFYETNGEPLYAELWGNPESSTLEDFPSGEDPRSWSVLYVPDGSSALRRVPFPGELNERVRFIPCEVQLSMETTIPDVDAAGLLALGLSDQERSAYIELYYAAGSPNRGRWEEGGNRLLGHPYTLGAGSSIVEADLASRGLGHLLWNGISDDERPTTEREAEARWRLLLQLDSAEVTGMDWAGGGVLHVCIEREALAQRDFSRTWFNLQFA